MIVGIEQPQGRVAQQGIVQFVAVGLLYAALGLAQDVAQAGILVVFVSREYLVGHSRVEVVVVADVYHAGGGDEGDASAAGVEAENLAARGILVVVAAEVAGGGDEEGQPLQIHRLYVGDVEQVFVGPGHGAAVADVVDYEHSVVEYLEEFLLGRGIGAAGRGDFGRIGIGVDFVDEAVGVAVLEDGADVFGLLHVDGVVLVVGYDTHLVFP